MYSWKVANTEPNFSSQRSRNLLDVTNENGKQPPWLVDFWLDYAANQNLQKSMPGGGWGVSTTKEKTKGELIMLWKINKYKQQDNFKRKREVGREKRRDYCRFCGNKDGSTPIMLTNINLPEKARNTNDLSTTPLRHLISICLKFINQEGMMEHAKKTGVKVVLKPKCWQGHWVCLGKRIFLSPKSGKSWSFESSFEHESIFTHIFFFVG